MSRRTAWGFSETRGMISECKITKPPPSAIAWRLFVNPLEFREAKFRLDIFSDPCYNIGNDITTGDEDMQDKGLLALLIDNYFNLQRIIKNSDPKKEAEYQLKLVAAKLEAMGVVTTKIEKDDD